MSRTITRWTAPLAIAIAVALSACTDKKKDDTLAQDTSLNRDLQMANADTTAQPALKDVPAGTVAPAPVTTAPSAPTRTRNAPSGRTVVRTPPRRVTAPPAPTTATTSTGNTVTRSAGGAGVWDGALSSKTLCRR